MRLTVIAALSASLLPACAPTPKCASPPPPPEPAAPAEPVATIISAGDEPPAAGPVAGSAAVAPPIAEPKPSARHDDFPGWLIAGSAPSQYDFVRDTLAPHSGKVSARLSSLGDPGDKFGTLMQTVVADKYLGKRVRFSAFVRSAKIGGWAGLWMRIDRTEGRKGAFDNMQDRAIKGTTDWKKYAVVLDVPKDATTVNYGVLLGGSGSVWMDGATLEIVPASVPTTDVSSKHHGPAPTNLDFEDEPPKGG